MPSSRAKRFRPVGPKASTSANTSTLTSISISMVSASKPLITLILALTCAGSLAAQSPAPLRLSFADAVRQATGASQAVPPSVSIAGFRSDAAAARVRQVRSGLLPDLTVSGSWVNRSFNSKTLGFSFPGPVVIPTRIGPFSAYDGRARLTQTLCDFSNLGRMSAAKGQVRTANAERSAVVETGAQNVALALARALGLDPATPIALTDTLTAQLGTADVPADRDAAVAQAVAARPDLAAEIARGAAAR